MFCLTSQLFLMTTSAEMKVILKIQKCVNCLSGRVDTSSLEPFHALSDIGSFKKDRQYIIIKHNLTFLHPNHKQAAVESLQRIIGSSEQYSTKLEERWLTMVIFLLPFYLSF
jgi:hypothetical protein